MSRWNPVNGDLYENMMDKIRRTGGRYAAVLWYQGCSDTEPESAGSYFIRFKAFVEAVRRALGYEIPFFTMQLNRQINGLYDEAWGMVREAQRRAALEIPKVAVLSTTNLSLSDGIHNSAQANVALGEKLARQCAGVLNGLEEYNAPSLCGGEMLTAKEAAKLGLEGSWLRLTFDHVKNCFLLYSGLGADSGFTLTDIGGEIKILRIRANREDKNNIYLQLERRPDSDISLSFAWQADPVRLPVVDEVTYLPPLSFYQVCIAEKRISRNEDLL